MTQATSEQYEVFPIRLWSPLRRQLDATGQRRCKPLQWLGIIRNLQQKGVSAAEIDWMSIIPELGCLPPDQPVPVEELLAYLDEYPTCELVLQRLVTTEFTPSVHYVRQERPDKFPPFTVRRGQREVRLMHFRDRCFGLCLWLHVQVDSGFFGRHRYWSFSVPRGRKHLPAFVSGKEFATAPEAMAYGRALIHRFARRLASQGFVGQAKTQNQYTKYVLPGGEHYSEWLITAPHLPVSYWGPHFDIRNLVAHVRTTERVTATGERLLMLEEIQSDWNQELREAMRKPATPQPAGDWRDEPDGWQERPPDNPYLNHWLDAALRMMLALAASRGLAGIVWLPGERHGDRYLNFLYSEASGLKVFYDQIVPAAMGRLAKSWGAQIDQAQMAMPSRRFVVLPAAGDAPWRVICRDTRRVIADGFKDYQKAEEFRAAQEVPTPEMVKGLYITEAMRDDIRRNGLPYLGSVGNRLGDLKWPSGRPPGP